MDEEEYEISAEDAHDDFNHRIIVSAPIWTKRSMRFPPKMLTMISIIASSSQPRYGRRGV
jgi:hypothetical protein